MKVSVLLVLVLAGLNEAVTPAGTPDAVKLTEPSKPPRSATAIVVVPLAPPAFSVRALSEDDRLKLAEETVTPSVTDAFVVPEVPVTVAV